jgi:ferric-chelate reductase
MDTGAAHLLQTLAADATAAGGGHGATTGKKPKKHYYYMARNGWETIAAVILALTIINLFTRGLAYLRRRRLSNKSAADFLDKREMLAGDDLKFSRIPYAGRSVLQNIGFCTTVPWWLGGLTLGEVFWNVGYATVLGVLSFHQTTLKNYGGWGNQAGHLAYSQIPLIIGLAGKNNVISCESSLSPRTFACPTHT